MAGKLEENRVIQKPYVSPKVEVIPLKPKHTMLGLCYSSSLGTGAIEGSGSAGCQYYDINNQLTDCFTRG